MSEGVILAIDNGTQSLRVLAFTSNGELLDKAQVALTNYQSPQAGWMEHEAEGFYDALVAACQLLWSQQKVAPENVRAVVVTTQRATVINLDKDGQPLRPAIIWPDQRRAQITSQRPLLWRVLFRLLKLKPTIDALEQECEF
ncbi:MAG: FGGY family carbohydrate kinase, partial [Proteobacteria bacterium]|nr:FGGY family carbohydrate kinase [Pseudomonadota bacterium]